MSENATGGLRRQLGLAAVMAVVMGDMLGSGIFFTPGELALVAEHPWQVYLIWTVCGLIVLAGALTLGELASLLPRAGASYHIIREAYGPFWGFVKVWMEAVVSAPGSIAAIAVVFGEYVTRLSGASSEAAPYWGLAAIALFAGINLLGVRWGGRTQVALTAVKIVGLLALVGGSLLFAEAAAPTSAVPGETTEGLVGFFRFVGLGVAAVLFTYDGWTDVSHVAGEVDNPGRALPLGLGVGVLGILLVYLIVNFAFLRVMPLALMREEGATVGTALAVATFGSVGGQIVNGFIMVSIFGALGGLVMTAPRIVYAPAEDYARSTHNPALTWLAGVSPSTGVPANAVVFVAVLASVAILFFGTFARLVAFIVVPLQAINILLVAAVFRLRSRTAARPKAFLTPGYPVVPLVFVVVMSLLLVSSIVFNPVDTIFGVGILALSAPVYLWLSWRSSISTERTS